MSDDNNISTEGIIEERRKKLELLREENRAYLNNFSKKNVNAPSNDSTLIINPIIVINLNGIFLVTKAVFSIMKKARYGRIISASSINGFAGAFGQANYAATKAGIVGFTKVLCKEGGKYGITVNSIAPGHIETDMTNKMPTEMIKSAIKMIPLERAGTPEEIAYAYLFLASKEASFINGITLHANGGALTI